MGCDIHECVEVRKDGRWEAVLGKNRYFEEYEDEPEYTVAGALGLERDYMLFTVLAGVRMRDGVEPIAPPRGLPSDVTGKVRFASDEEGADGHSHSWLTMEELMAYDSPHRGCLTSVIQSLCGRGDPRDVRLVFWFDN